MDFYAIQAGQANQFYSGEFWPYPDLGGLILGSDPAEDLTVKIVRGGRPGDMVFAAFGVVSGRFINVLDQCDATGYTAHPMVMKKGSQVIPDFFLLKLTGRGGPYDEVKSNLIRHGDGAIMKFDGVYIYESQWDGSDVFSIGGGIGIYVTERIGMALKKAKLRNVRIIPNAECRL